MDMGDYYEGSERASKLPDTGTRSQFKTGAVRDGMEGKGIPSLIPTEAMLLLSKRLEDGAKKYGRDNWRKGIPLSRYIDGWDRHLRKFRLGWQDEDHLGAMLFNAVGFVETALMIMRGQLSPDMDDLPEAPLRSTGNVIPSNFELAELYYRAHKDPYEPTEYDKKRMAEMMEASRPPEERRAK